MVVEINDLRVTLVQSHLYWNQPKKNRDHLSQILDNISSTDIIVLPELFTTSFSLESATEHMSGPSMLWMADIANKFNSLVMGSLPIEVNQKKYNRLIAMKPDGSYEFYDKRHLFSLMKEQEFFQAGSDRKMINFKGWKICPLICYDLRFPVFSRNTEEYDLLIYVANWPVNRIKHWDKLLEARAIENQCYTIGVNRIGFDDNGIQFNGQSKLIDMSGEIIQDLKSEECAKTITMSKSLLDSYRTKFPFLSDKDNFNILPSN